jgi:KDO2-lipid IV(A) lauroyltransferase
VRDVVTGCGDFVLHHLMRVGTTESCSAVGAWLGVGLGPRVRGRGLRAQQALARLRPDLSNAERAALLRRMWANVGRTMAEFSVSRRLWRSDRVAVLGLEHLEAALASGRPRIYICLHLGNWELIGPKLLSLGEDLMQFFQPPANRFTRGIAEATRRPYRDRLLPPGPASAQRAYRFLKERRGSLVMFVDEFIRGRVQAPAFGRPVSLEGNVANAVRLALLSNAVILPVYLLRRSGARFCMEILPPVDIERDGSDSTDLEQNVGRVEQIIAPIVRANLEQWFMLHELRLDAAGPG